MADVIRAISISHWGMFEIMVPFRFVVPAGFRLTDQEKAEWKRPDGIIEIVRL